MAAPQFTGQVEWPVKIEVNRGLEGALACETAIGYVNGTEGKLVYRGYDINDIAEQSTFEEVTFLLLEGRLPTQAELDQLVQSVKSAMPIPQELKDMITKIASKNHPMATLRTAVSYLSTLDPNADETTPENERRIALDILGKIATITGAVARVRRGQTIVDPDPNLTYSENLLLMMNGERPDAEVARVMDVALTLHADHGMNASTFTSMVANSSLSDMYSTIVAGICSLKGPLHGGANERALKQLQEMGDPASIPQKVQQAFANKEKIMGFGHRVYKAYDPRAKVLGRYAKEVAERTGVKELYETAVVLEEEVLKHTKDKGIYPNVDFYSGIIYNSMSIETDMFTPLFAVSRVSGWAARVLEYLPNNRLFRPRAQYVGEFDRQYVPISER